MVQKGPIGPKKGSQLVKYQMVDHFGPSKNTIWCKEKKRKKEEKKKRKRKKGQSCHRKNLNFKFPPMLPHHSSFGI